MATCQRLTSAAGAESTLFDASVSLSSACTAKILLGCLSYRPAVCCCRCASLGVRACVLMPVDLEIAPLDLGSSGSAAFCIGWQAADLAVQHKFSLRQPEDSACMRVSIVLQSTVFLCSHVDASCKFQTHKNAIHGGAWELASISPCDVQVDGKHDAPWEQSKRVKGGDEGPVRGACTAKESQHRSLGGRTQKCAADIEVSSTARTDQTMQGP